MSEYNCRFQFHFLIKVKFDLWFDFYDLRGRVTARGLDELRSFTLRLSPYFFDEKIYNYNRTDNAQIIQYFVLKGSVTKVWR